MLNYLNDLDEIKVEGATLKVFHTPGHSQDHLVIQLKEENAIFSADCVLGEGTVVFENLSKYLKSLERLLEMNGKKFYPGHGPVVDNPKVKINDYFKTRMEREAQIVDVLSGVTGYISAMDIVKKIYKVCKLHFILNISTIIASRSYQEI